MKTWMCRGIWLGGIAWLMVVAGCGAPLLRSYVASETAEEVPEPTVLLIGDVSSPIGMNYAQVEAVSLVTGLAGTGGDPAPSPQRAQLVAEMQRRDVEDHAGLLKSPRTSMVLVRAFLRPGIQKGDRFDVEVRVPSRSNTQSLRNGFLLESRLTELAALDNRIHQGHVMALAKGPVLVDPMAEPGEALATHGRVLGGGVATKDRTLGLVLDDPYQTIRMSERVGRAINRRFYTYFGGTKEGVSNPQTQEFIEVALHPRYRKNVGRYMRVLRSLPLEESPSEHLSRLEALALQIEDPLTAASAALKLEAAGDDQAKEILRNSLKSLDSEVRFYAAEALAYLDDTEAVDTLIAAIEEEPAYRVYALSALSSMQDRRAAEGLQSLLNSKSAETRYGAFRALWVMDPDNPFIKGHDLGGFHLHIVPTDGEQMIHVTKSRRPEVVLFGTGQELRTPFMLDAGSRILINGTSADEVRISRFAEGEQAQVRTVSAKVDEVIRAIVDLGGEYPDVVQALQHAQEKEVLACRFRVDALPLPGRERSSKPEEQLAQTPEEKSTAPVHVASPLPGLFKDAPE